MEEKKPLTYIILVLAIVVGLGAWLFLGDKEDDNGEKNAERTTANEAPPSVSPDIKLTPEEKSGNVSAKKAWVLARVRSDSPLTVEEKREITLIMATKANIYNFSQEERLLIFAAFNR